MSILFKALNKVAKDYREKKAPIIVPLVKMPVDSDVKKQFKIVLVTICAVFVVGFLFSVLSEGRENNEIEKPVEFIKSFAKNKKEDFENGIKLSEDKLKDKNIELIENQIKQSNALSKNEKTSSGSLVSVTESRFSVKEQLESADDYVNIGNWDKALLIYNKILKNHFGNKSAFHGKIYSLSQRGKDRDLIELNYYTKIMPTSSEIHAARAKVLSKQKRFVDAIVAWNKACNLAPNNDDYKLGLAVTYDNLGRYKKAISVYRSLKKPLSIDIQKRLSFLESRNNFYIGE